MFTKQLSAYEAPPCTGGICRAFFSNVSINEWEVKMKILVGYDLSNVAKEALELAKKHAKAFDAKVYVVRSLAQSREMKLEDIQKAEQELENIRRSFRDEGIACKTEAIVSSISPGEDLVQFAQEKEIDEIVIGVRRRSKVGKLLFGSNAQYIILMARCPVVSVK
jgi:nucleotide-binding universal stress UspA family protein